MKLIFLSVLSIFLVKILTIFMGVEPEEKKKEAVYFVTAENGTIGCLSKEYFFKAGNFYKNGNYAQAQKLLDDEICYFFKKGARLYADEGTCSEKDGDHDIFPFKPNDFIALQPYLPCYAVR